MPVDSEGQAWNFLKKKKKAFWSLLLGLKHHNANQHGVFLSQTWQQNLAMSKQNPYDSPIQDWCILMIDVIHNSGTHHLHTSQITPKGPQFSHHRVMERGWITCKGCPEFPTKLSSSFQNHQTLSVWFRFVGTHSIHTCYIHLHFVVGFHGKWK